MLRVIIKKEILETIISPKFVFTFLLCIILILLSLYTGIANYRTEQKEYTAATALNKKNLESQSNYQTLATLGTKINKAPPVLSTIVGGINEAVGRVATVNIAFDPNLVDSKYESNPVFAVFGALDMTFIVKIVLSLFAILFTYDAIVGEKEQGTLKLALSNELPRDRLIMGKIIGGYISLIIPLIIPFLLGLIMLITFPNINMRGEDWVRLGLIFLLYFLYLSVFFSLGLFVSARTHKSSTSFLVLLFIWVTFVTIIPKASVMIAGQINPIPSVHEITAKKDAFFQQIQAESQKKVNKYLRENVMKSKLTPQDTQEQFRKWLEDFQQEMTSKIDETNAAIERDYQIKKILQQHLAVNLSRISPSSALMFASMSLAQTGLEEHERFLSSVRAYKPSFTKWTNARLMGTLNVQTGETGKVVLDDMPQFVFQPESLGNSFSRTLPDFGLILFLIIFFFTGAYMSFIKYDVR